MRGELALAVARDRFVVRRDEVPRRQRRSGGDADDVGDGRRRERLLRRTRHVAPSVRSLLLFARIDDGQQPVAVVRLW
jgi:hypothetical protein